MVCEIGKRRSVRQIAIVLAVLRRNRGESIGKVDLLHGCATGFESGDDITAYSPGRTADDNAAPREQIVTEPRDRYHSAACLCVVLSTASSAAR